MHVNESLLVRVLKSIFPKENIEQNVKKNIHLLYPSTGSYMEFDVWIPSLDLCFEFQDVHHYTTAWYFQNTTSYIKEQDNIKRVLAYKRGLYLISIPYWWDGRPESLEASISFQRPDIQLKMANPISINPPFNFIKSDQESNMGEFMLASLPSHHFKDSIASSSWWLGEKYDGIRCWWHSIQHKFYNRSGNNISILPAIINTLSPSCTDNEIWFGRGQFSQTYFLSKVDCDWSSFRLLSFDAPLPGLAYEPRHHHLLRSIEDEHPVNQVPARLSYVTHALKSVVKGIIDFGGEGVIMQKYNSLYERGRSLSLLKLKTTEGDREGIVMHVSKDNAITLKLASGAHFTVPPQNININFPHKIKVGDVVTFSFDIYSRRDIPLNPKIYKIRTDLNWDDVVNRESKDAVLNETSVMKGYTNYPKGYWTPKNMRSFMFSFAKNRGLEALKSESWYNSFRSFFASRNGRIILRKFNNGYYEALSNLFPEIVFDPSMLKQAYYKVDHRRAFFEKYANSKKFDPLDPNGWYQQTRESIMATKGAARVIFYHNNSLVKSLLDLFPNIDIDRSKLQFRQNLWNDVEHRRHFFENYAREYKFDPLVASNWHSQRISSILNKKGAERMIAYHGSITRALQQLFPELKGNRLFFTSDSSQFRSNSWKDPRSRRQFFERFAVLNQFDPLVPENWYTKQVHTNLMKVKGIERVIFYHKYSIINALIDLFPSIGLQKEKFLIRQNLWAVSENRRKLFEQYAAANHFNPLLPDQWYKQPISKMLSFKGASRVLQYHKGSIEEALLDLFPNIGLSRAFIRR